MYDLIPHIINGLALGLLFALLALGFMLIIGVMEVINLAHGSLFALGAYIALVVMTPDGGLPFAFMQPYYDLPVIPRYIIALIVGPIVVGVVGMGLEICLRRTYGKDPLYGLLLTFGAAMVLEEGIREIWGSSEYALPIPRGISGGFIAGDLIYSNYRIYAAIFSAAMIGVLWVFLNKTPYGAVIKAGAHDSEMVRALGYNLKRLRLYVFAFGAALAAIAGIIMAPIWGIRPVVGVDAVVPAFVVIVLGGVGSFWGSVSAGILVGLVVGLTAAFLTDWSLLSMYLLLLAVVTFRARGLAGKASVLEA
ncbi:MAG: branched-chain amino acid ABC transporter permease [Rhodospirillaceae bacterium]|nr:branched-chain amino acid ABC transporter permease [Rhodospirillaceae bacterium]MBT6136024.1 branched-chain amino acid ABC transporter permease [Rhodospirillaceae bacterium]